MSRRRLAIYALPIDPSERMAKLKACKRAKIVKVGDWIIALSHVSAYQASAAKALDDLGAHMSAQLLAKRMVKSKSAFAAIATLMEHAKVHLGTDIAAPLGESLGGVGGGHAMAAGVSGKGEIQDALKQCLKLFEAEN